VPNLRFPEFGGVWETHLASDFFEFKNGLNPEAKRFGTGTKFISVMDILNNRYITYENIIASVEPKENDLHDFGVNYGDILFQRSSETLEDVGQANVYLDKRTALFGGFVIRGKKIGKYNPLFFRYMLSSPHVRKRIIVKGAGAQHFNIGQDGLRKVHLMVPTEKEQDKIGNFINLIDERIETQSRIIEKYDSLIKGMRDKLCKSNYANKVLGDISDIYQPQTISTSDLNKEGKYFVYGANGIIGKYDFYNHETEQICITCRGNTCGLVNYTVPFSWITGNAMVINTDNYLLQVNKRYLYHFLSLHNFNSIISGSGQPQIVRSPLTKIKIFLPDLKSQSVIANILDSICYKKQLEEKVLRAYNKAKSFFLFQLFI